MNRKHSTMTALDTAAGINALARFLADQQLNDLAAYASVDCIIICASAVLHSTEVLFRTLQECPTLTRQLVLCGGIGHSTQFLYQAVADHPQFHSLAKAITGLPEARVLERILDEFFDGAAIRTAGCQILVEDESTNCGSNAIKSRDVLERFACDPKNIILIQDPTMMLRTKASFEHAYKHVENRPRFISCPVFVPQVCPSAQGQLVYGPDSPPRLWDMQRFIDLILGEISRVRDDENGYGPNGRGFIGHIHVPAGIENAWGKLQLIFKGTRF
ncbi:YdcF family protein [Aspergillus chevalieri]|uniref:DUF218 domain-containing protein n=1 Tax=Aspergillus chevalieri TaxID=182096 RepID=A0A7R7ZPX4_ASPCH|nr:uncharacterized protein ACHE_51261A [Aspergillus chevalieri]BCR90063.1 hypothetical protein ACHE_51261A [Aspergillus chevalieri]